ncbi:MAG TPA: radical SAM protein, partial [Bacillota bacterium]|nr:radical SAM protein [Bacillota bacterium]
SCCNQKVEKDSLDLFLERMKNYTFCISGMAFQDVWNLELERLRYCSVHVVTPDGKFIPFCAYNLTNSEGVPLHRGR